MNQTTLTNMENNLTRVERKGRKIKRNIYRGFKSPLTIVICILLGFLLAMYTFYKMFMFLGFWFDEHKVVRQDWIKLKIQPPFRIEGRSEIPLKKKLTVPPKVKSKTTLPSVTPTPKLKTHIEIIDSMKYASILHRIYTLESSKGRNDACKNKNQFNGFGYGQNSTVWNCFDTFEEVASKVNNWFEKRFNEGYTEAEAISYYNTGIRQPNSKYYQAYLSL